MKNMLYCELCLYLGNCLKFDFEFLYVESSLLLLTFGGTELELILDWFFLFL